MDISILTGVCKLITWGHHLALIECPGEWRKTMLNKYKPWDFGVPDLQTNPSTFWGQYQQNYGDPKPTVLLKHTSCLDIKLPM